jgi:hypothetical protein
LFFGAGFANQQFGAPPAGVANIAFRDFLAGAPSSYFVASGTYDRGFRARDTIGFVQDDFRLSRRLTLNLGLRYDFLSNVSEKAHRMGNFDPWLVPAESRQYGGAGLLRGFIISEKLPGLGTPGVSDTTLLGEDKDNFSPRVSFGYDVLGNGKLAVRGGYGIYAIRLSAIPALQLTSQPPFYQQSSTGGFFGFDILHNPFPTLPLPNEFPLMPVAPTLLSLNPNGSPVYDRPTTLSVNAFERTMQTPYSQQWNFTVQYKFMPRWRVELGYVGSHSIKLYNIQNINNALLRNENNPGPFGLATNSTANAAARVPIPGFSTFGISMITESAKSFYDAGLVTVSHEFARGLFIKAAYTFAKSLDNNSAASDFDIGGVSGNQFLPDLNKGPSDFDVRHRLVVTYVYNLPAVSHGVWRRILSDWSISGITTAQTGYPGSLIQGLGLSLSGNSGRANVVSGCDLVGSGKTSDNLDHYLNPTCVQAPPLLSGGATFGPLSPQEGRGDQIYSITPGGSGRLQGTSGRGIFRGPIQSRWDVTAAKKIPLRVLGDRGGAQVRAEFFNLVNHPMFANPNAVAGAPSFGRIAGTLGIARQIQFGLKVGF